jgi:hypothetical protein
VLSYNKDYFYEDRHLLCEKICVRKCGALVGPLSGSGSQPIWVADSGDTLYKVARRRFLSKMLNQLKIAKRIINAKFFCLASGRGKEA